MSMQQPQPNKRRMTVRLIWASNRDNELKGDRSGLLIEQLRYAGLLSILRETSDYYVLEISAPAGRDVAQWAESNAARMRSFGLNATVAPAWDGEPPTSGEIAERSL